MLKVKRVFKDIIQKLKDFFAQYIERFNEDVAASEEEWDRAFKETEIKK